MEFKGTKEETFILEDATGISLFTQRSLVCRTKNKPNREQAMANVILFQTAPELLEDLQEAVELFESAYSCMADGNNEGLYNALANATSRTRFKETIAKALGKEVGNG